MKAIIVSDLHMGSRYFQSEAFTTFLASLSDIDELILNGDFLDRPGSKLALRHQQSLERIEQLSLRFKVVWVQGNHDKGYMPVKLGQIEFCQRYIFDHRILVTHGDDFDHIMRPLVGRSEELQVILVAIHGERFRLLIPLHPDQHNNQLPQ